VVNSTQMTPLIPTSQSLDGLLKVQFMAVGVYCALKESCFLVTLTLITSTAS